MIFLFLLAQTYVGRLGIIWPNFVVSRWGGGYSHTLPIWVCAAQWGRDFEAPGLERGIHFRGVF